MKMTIEERLTQLEKSNLRWQRLTAILCLLLVTLGIMGAKHIGRTNVAIGQLRLLNREGKLRAVLGVTKNDAAYLALRDKEGKVRCHLSLDKKGTPSLTLNDEKGEKRCILSLFDKGCNPSMIFYDGEQKRRLSLTTVPPALICNNHNGKPRAVLGVSKTGAGAFSLEDVHGRPIVFKRLK